MGSQNYVETLKSAVVAASTSGADNTIIAAPTGAGEYLCIDFIAFVAANAVTVALYSGSTALSGVMTLAQYQSVVMENAMQNDDGVITCAPGEAFKVTLGGAVGINGIVRYRIKGGM